MTQDGVRPDDAEDVSPNPTVAESVRDACVVCLIEMDRTNRTSEHVYPQWLQEHVATHSKHLALPDGRLASYAGLLVPLCATCNNKDLGQMEDKVAAVFRDTSPDPQSAPPGLLYVWLYKIYALNQIFSLSQTGYSFDQDGSAMLAYDADVLDAGLRRLSQVRDSSEVVFPIRPPGSVLFSRVTDEFVERLGPFDWYDSTVLGAARLRVFDVVIHVCFEDDRRVVEAMQNASTYKSPFDDPMGLEDFLDFSAAFFAHSASVRRPQFLFVGATGLVPAGPVRWEPTDRVTWHERWLAFYRTWASDWSLLDERN